MAGMDSGLLTSRFIFWFWVILFANHSFFLFFSLINLLEGFPKCISMECIFLGILIRFKSKRCVVQSVWESKLNQVKKVLCQDLRCSAVSQEPSGDMSGTIPFLTSGPREPMGRGSLWLRFFRT